MKILAGTLHLHPSNVIELDNQQWDAFRKHFIPQQLPDFKKIDNYPDGNGILADLGDIFLIIPKNFKGTCFQTMFGKDEAINKLNVVINSVLSSYCHAINKECEFDGIFAIKIKTGKISINQINKIIDKVELKTEDKDFSIKGINLSFEKGEWNVILNRDLKTISLGIPFDFKIEKVARIDFEKKIQNIYEKLRSKVSAI